MTDYTDRSTEALLARWAIAEKATLGPWWAETAPFFVPLAYAVRCKTGRLAGLNSHADGSHIAANSPDVVMADIDEILRLRKEVKRLEKELKAAQDFASSQHEVAKLAWGGEIPSPLPGHPSMTEDEVCAMFEHLNCPWCGGSGHVGDCGEADQTVKRRLEHLEEEANWLATHLANALREPALIAHLRYLSNGLTVPPSLEMLREAARKAVEEPCPKN